MAALEEYECLRIHISIMPEKFMKQRELEELKDKDGCACTEVHGGMCGFPQAGMLAHKDLLKRLKVHGHTPTTFAPGLWTHQSNGISFALVVDDLGVKHSSISSLSRLLKVLKNLQHDYEHKW